VVALRRVFLAVSLDDESRHRIAARLDGIEIPGAHVSPQKWHVTMRFVGGVDEVLLDRIQAALDEGDLGDPFDVSWGGLGAFPKAAKATVLWIGIDRGFEDLTGLAGRMGIALQGAGLDLEDRPFRPHLTISRIRPQQDVAELVESFPPLGGTLRVGAIDLYQSHLGPHGARYELVERFGFA